MFEEPMECLMEALTALVVCDKFAYVCFPYHERPFSGVSRILMGLGEMRYPHVKVQDAMRRVHLWGAIHVATMYKCPWRQSKQAVLWSGTDRLLTANSA